jgi:hypothetical protein
MTSQPMQSALDAVENIEPEPEAAIATGEAIEISDLPAEIQAELELSDDDSGDYFNPFDPANPLAFMYYDNNPDDADDWPVT